MFRVWIHVGLNSALGSWTAACAVNVLIHLRLERMSLYARFLLHMCAHKHTQKHSQKHQFPWPNEPVSFCHCLISPFKRLGKVPGGSRGQGRCGIRNQAWDSCRERGWCTSKCPVRSTYCGKSCCIHQCQAQSLNKFECTQACSLQLSIISLSSLNISLTFFQISFYPPFHLPLPHLSQATALAPWMQAHLSSAHICHPDCSAPCWGLYTVGSTEWKLQETKTLLGSQRIIRHNGVFLLVIVSRSHVNVKRMWTSVYPPFLFHIPSHIKNISTQHKKHERYSKAYFSLICEERPRHKIPIPFDSSPATPVWHSLGLALYSK